MMLTDKKAQSLKPTDKPVADGTVTGLFLTPTNKGANWSLRFTSPVSGKRREAGLGTYPATSIRDARAKGTAMRTVIEAGKDPIEERDRERAASVKDSKVKTFGAAAKTVHTELKKGWKDTRNVKRWLASVEQHLAPILYRRVDTLKASDFADALRDAWTRTPRAAADVLQRASVIMQWCEAHEYVEYDPTQRVRKLLAKQDNTVQHQPALPWKIAPAFVRDHLSDIKPTEVIRACLYVQMLTACRPNEARGMCWAELDLDAATWSIPAERMKSKLPHKVPLVPEAVDLLRRVDALRLHQELVFPNTLGKAALAAERLQEFMRKTGAPSDTAGRARVPHGSRNTFKDWALDNGFDERVADRQLAHRPKGQTAQAYERTTLFERRAELLRAWSDYLHAPANVIHLPLAAA
jgi:integrase